MGDEINPTSGGMKRESEANIADTPDISSAETNGNGDSSTTTINSCGSIFRVIGGGGTAPASSNTTINDNDDGFKKHEKDSENDSNVDAQKEGGRELSNNLVEDKNEIVNSATGLTQLKRKAVDDVNVNGSLSAIDDINEEVDEAVDDELCADSGPIMMETDGAETDVEGGLNTEDGLGGDTVGPPTDPCLISEGLSSLIGVGPPSPLTGCYLLIILSEPHSEEHRNIILQRLIKGLLSWDVNDCHIDLEDELSIISQHTPEGEEARYGERLIQYASENLVTEILIHPQYNTLIQCMRNLLSSFTRHRHIIHSGYTFSGNGSWIIQDATFSTADFAEAFQENDVQRVLRAYPDTITMNIHCADVGQWSTLPDKLYAKSCRIRVNPINVLESDNEKIIEFIDYLTPMLVPATITDLLQTSDVVGNIRFSHPTLYVFPGGQGDAALFGINGFNMLVDGGFNRKACFWDFARHLDRLDAVLMTRINNCNLGGMSALIERKQGDHVYPQIGHFFCNVPDRKENIVSSESAENKDPLVIKLVEQGHNLVRNLRNLNLKPQICYRDSDPINLYHKVGHGTLDMYVISPAKESKEVKEFLQKWNNNEDKLFSSKDSKEFNFPLQNLVSICAMLVWQPANPDDAITRILFPGSSPDFKILEGLDRIKHLEFMKHPTCTAKSLASVTQVVPANKKYMKSTLADKAIPEPTVPSKIVKPMPVNDTKVKTIQQDNKAKDSEEHISSSIKEKQSKLLKDEQVMKQVKDDMDENMIGRIDAYKQTEKVTSVTTADELDNKVATEKKVEVVIVKPQNPDIAKKDETEAKFKQKTKTEKPRAEVKPVVRSRIDTKPPKSMERKSFKKDLSNDKKASPTSTPQKREVVRTDYRESKSKVISRMGKSSPSATPAKSAKDANNRKVLESKHKVSIRTVREVSTKGEKKEIKLDRKPISRRPRGASPTKTPGSPVKTIKAKTIKSRMEKGGTATTDSSLVSTPSTDEVVGEKKMQEIEDREIEAIKQRELDDLKEEQEVVREIEAVFNRDELKKTEIKIDHREVSKDDSQTEVEEDEEYLIIEKEEVEQYTEDSINEQESSVTKEEEMQKHQRDSQESEKKRKTSAEEEIEVAIQKANEIDKKNLQDFSHKNEEMCDKEFEENIQPDSIEEKIAFTSYEKTEIKAEVQEIITSAKEIVQTKTEEINKTEEISSPTPEEKISSAKKTSDTKDDVLEVNEGKEINLQESLPEEKFSATIESGATTAPTLPEDERIPLDDIKEDLIIEEKYQKENTKEIDIPISPTKLTIIEHQERILPTKMQFDLQSNLLRDIVKTPDEVADLPMHEEAEITYEEDSNEKKKLICKDEGKTVSLKEEKAKEEKEIEDVHEVNQDVQLIQEAQKKENLFDENQDAKPAATNLFEKIQETVSTPIDLAEQNVIFDIRERDEIESSFEELKISSVSKTESLHLEIKNISTKAEFSKVDVEKISSSPVDVALIDTIEVIEKQESAEIQPNSKLTTFEKEDEEMNLGDKNIEISDSTGISIADNQKKTADSPATVEEVYTLDILEIKPRTPQTTKGEETKESQELCELEKNEKVISLNKPEDVIISVKNEEELQRKDIEEHSSSETHPSFEKELQNVNQIRNVELLERDYDSTMTQIGNEKSDSEVKLENIEGTLSEKSAEANIYPTIQEEPILNTEIYATEQLSLTKKSKDKTASTATNEDIINVEDLKSEGENRDRTSLPLIGIIVNQNEKTERQSCLNNEEYERENLALNKKIDLILQENEQSGQIHEDKSRKVSLEEVTSFLQLDQNQSRKESVPSDSFQNEQSKMESLSSLVVTSPVKTLENILQSAEECSFENKTPSPVKQEKLSGSEKKLENDEIDTKNEDKIIRSTEEVDSGDIERLLYREKSEERKKSPTVGDETETEADEKPKPESDSVFRQSKDEKIFLEQKSDKVSATVMRDTINKEDAFILGEETDSVAQEMKSEEILSIAGLTEDFTTNKPEEEKAECESGLRPAVSTKTEDDLPVCTGESEPEEEKHSKKDSFVSETVLASEISDEKTIVPVKEDKLIIQETGESNLESDITICHGDSANKTSSSPVIQQNLGIKETEKISDELVICNIKNKVEKISQTKEVEKLAQEKQIFESEEVPNEIFTQHTSEEKTTSALTNDFTITETNKGKKKSETGTSPLSPIKPENDRLTLKEEFECEEEKHLETVSSSEEPLSTEKSYDKIISPVKEDKLETKETEEPKTESDVTLSKDEVKQISLDKQSANDSVTEASKIVVTDFKDKTPSPASQEEFGIKETEKIRDEFVICSIENEENRTSQAKEVVLLAEEKQPSETTTNDFSIIETKEGKLESETSTSPSSPIKPESHKLSLTGEFECEEEKHLETLYAGNKLLSEEKGHDKIISSVKEDKLETKETEEPKTESDVTLSKDEVKQISLEKQSQEDSVTEASKIVVIDSEYKTPSPASQEEFEIKETEKIRDEFVICSIENEENKTSQAKEVVLLAEEKQPSEKTTNDFSIIETKEGKLESETSTSPSSPIKPESHKLSLTGEFECEEEKHLETVSSSEKPLSTEKSYDKIISPVKEDKLETKETEEPKTESDVTLSKDEVKQISLEKQSQENSVTEASKIVVIDSEYKTPSPSSQEEFGIKETEKIRDEAVICSIENEENKISQSKEVVLLVEEKQPSETITNDFSFIETKEGKLESQPITSPSSPIKPESQKLSLTGEFECEEEKHLETVSSSEKRLSTEKSYDKIISPVKEDKLETKETEEPKTESDVTLSKDEVKQISLEKQSQEDSVTEASKIVVIDSEYKTPSPSSQEEFGIKETEKIRDELVICSIENEENKISQSKEVVLLVEEKQHSKTITNDFSFIETKEGKLESQPITSPSSPIKPESQKLSLTGEFECEEEKHLETVSSSEKPLSTEKSYDKIISPVKEDKLETKETEEPKIESDFTHSKDEVKQISLEKQSEIDLVTETCKITIINSEDKTTSPASHEEFEIKETEKIRDEFVICSIENEENKTSQAKEVVLLAEEKQPSEKTTNDFSIIETKEGKLESETSTSPSSPIKPESHKLSLTGEFECEEEKHLETVSSSEKPLSTEKSYDKIISPVKEDKLETKETEEPKTESDVTLSKDEVKQISLEKQSQEDSVTEASKIVVIDSEYKTPSPASQEEFGIKETEKIRDEFVICSIENEENKTSQAKEVVLLAEEKQPSEKTTNDFSIIETKEAKLVSETSTSPSSPIKTENNELSLTGEFNCEEEKHLETLSAGKKLLSEEKCHDKTVPSVKEDILDTQQTEKPKIESSATLSQDEVKDISVEKQSENDSVTEASEIAVIDSEDKTPSPAIQEEFGIKETEKIKDEFVICSIENEEKKITQAKEVVLLAEEKNTLETAMNDFSIIEAKEAKIELETGTSHSSSTFYSLTGEFQCEQEKHLETISLSEKVLFSEKSYDKSISPLEEHKLKTKETEEPIIESDVTLSKDEVKQISLEKQSENGSVTEATKKAVIDSESKIPSPASQEASGIKETEKIRDEFVICSIEKEKITAGEEEVSVADETQNSENQPVSSEILTQLSTLEEKIIISTPTNDFTITKTVETKIESNSDKINLSDSSGELLPKEEKHSKTDSIASEKLLLTENCDDKTISPTKEDKFEIKETEKPEIESDVTLSKDEVKQISMQKQSENDSVTEANKIALIDSEDKTPSPASQEALGIKETEKMRDESVVCSIENEEEKISLAKEAILLADETQNSESQPVSSEILTKLKISEEKLIISTPSTDVTTHKPEETKIELISDQALVSTSPGELMREEEKHSKTDSISSEKLLPTKKCDDETISPEKEDKLGTKEIKNPKTELDASVFQSETKEISLIYCEEKVKSSTKLDNTATEETEKSKFSCDNQTEINEPDEKTSSPVTQKDSDLIGKKVQIKEKESIEISGIPLAEKLKFSENKQFGKKSLDDDQSRKSLLVDEKIDDEEEKALEFIGLKDKVDDYISLERQAKEPKFIAASSKKLEDEIIVLTGLTKHDLIEEHVSYKDLFPTEFTEESTSKSVEIADEKWREDSTEETSSPVDSNVEKKDENTFFKTVSTPVDEAMGEINVESIDGKDFEELIVNTVSDQTMSQAIESFKSTPTENNAKLTASSPIDEPIPEFNSENIDGKDSDEFDVGNDSSTQVHQIIAQKSKSMSQDEFSDVMKANELDSSTTIEVTTFTTELRETHITTLDSPQSENLSKTTSDYNIVVFDRDESILHEIKEEEEEIRTSPKRKTNDQGVEILDLEKDHTQIPRPVSPREIEVFKIVANVAEVLKSDKPITEIIPDFNEEELEKKLSQTIVKDESQTVQRMLVTASSEDGGEEIEICPKGTIKFIPSVTPDVHSGRTSPDLVIADNYKKDVHLLSEQSPTDEDTKITIRSLADSEKSSPEVKSASHSIEEKEKYEISEKGQFDKEEKILLEEHCQTKSDRDKTHQILQIREDYSTPKVSDGKERENYNTDLGNETNSFSSVMMTSVLKPEGEIMAVNFCLTEQTLKNESEVVSNKSLDCAKALGSSNLTEAENFSKSDDHMKEMKLDSSVTTSDISDVKTPSTAPVSPNIKNEFVLNQSDESIAKSITSASDKKSSEFSSISLQQKYELSDISPKRDSRSEFFNSESKSGESVQSISTQQDLEISSNLSTSEVLKSDDTKLKDTENCLSGSSEKFITTTVTTITKIISSDGKETVTEEKITTTTDSKDPEKETVTVTKIRTTSDSEKSEELLQPLMATKELEALKRGESDDLDHHDVHSPRSDSSGQASRVTGDEETPQSPFSTTSQAAHSPISKFSYDYDLQQSNSSGFSKKSDIDIDDSQDDIPPQYGSDELHTARPITLMHKTDLMSTSYYGALPDPSTCLKSDPIPIIGKVSQKTFSQTNEEYIDSSEGGSNQSSWLSKKLDTKFLDEADLDFEKALEEHKQLRGEEVMSSVTAKYSYSPSQAEVVSETSEERFPLEDPILKIQQTRKEFPLTDETAKTEVAKPKNDVSNTSKTSPDEKELQSVNQNEDQNKSVDAKDPLKIWGKPLGLPSPAPVSNEDDIKTTPKREKRVLLSKTKFNNEKNLRKRSESPVKAARKNSPIFIDLTYVPHNGNSYYSHLEFFKRVRARYYVFSGTEPSRQVYDALLEAKQTWEDKSLEVTIIPTYDTDVLGYWVSENEELLAKYRIDLSPSASRCTINLQDHETSCSAYRLEF